MEYEKELVGENEVEDEDVVQDEEKKVRWEKRRWNMRKEK